MTRKTMIKKLDKITREIILKRDSYTCVTCGSMNRPTWSHLFGRRTQATRWDLENGFCQCWPCNFKHVRDQYPFFNWFIGKFGKEKLDALRLRFNTAKPIKLFELEEIYENLKKQPDGKNPLPPSG